MADHEMTGDSPQDASEQAKKKKTRRGGSRANKKAKNVDTLGIDLGLSNLKIAESTEESSGNLENNACQDVPVAQTAKNVPPSCSKNVKSKEVKKKGAKPDLSNTSASNLPAPTEANSNLEGSPAVAKKPRARRPKKKKIDSPLETQAPEKPASPKESRVDGTIIKALAGLKKNPNSFPDYLPLAELEKGIKSGKFVQGPIRVSQKNYKNCFVSEPEGHRPDILISELHNRNRALDGDVVVVCLNPETKWMVQGDQISEQAELDPEFRAAVEHLLGTNGNDQSKDYEVEEIVKYENGVEVARPQLEKRHNGQEKHDNGQEKLPIDLAKKLPNWERFVQRTGFVVGILEKVHNRKAVGYLTMFPDRNPNFALFKPKDSRIPRMKIPKEKCPVHFWNRPELYESSIFVGRVTLWNIPNYAIGELIDCLGDENDLNVQTAGILHQFDVDDSEFSAAAKSSLPSMPFEIPQEEVRKRKDYRKDCVFTIDPATARDLDDALSVTPLQNGNYLVAVHIADVSHFVLESSHLDSIAAQRGNTVYLVQKCVPMLPRELSEDLCSLNPGIDRLTFSVEWELTKTGEIINVWFGKSIIRSCTQLSYEDAQDLISKGSLNAEDLPRIEDPWTVDDISARLSILNEIAINIRKRRYDNGLLRIDQPKICFNINKESGIPVGFFIFQQLDTHRLVEEFMIMANVAVAKKIYETFPNLALLRNHPPPADNQMKKKEGWLKANGFNINLSSKKEFQASLERYIVSDKKIEADKNSDSLKKKKENSRSDVATKKLDDGAKLTTDNHKSIETFPLIDDDSMIPKNLNISSKPYKDVKQEATVDELQAGISERLNSFKNHTIPKEPGVDPLLVKKMKFLVVMSSLSMPMKLAEYVCAFDKEPSQLSHYALAEDLYTHFTSPIRRYPDVIVHRLLLAAISSSQPRLQSTEVLKICNNCNKKKMLAKKASEKSDELFLASFIANSELVEEVAIVTQIFDRQIKCLIRNLGTERNVDISKLPEVKDVHRRKNKPKGLEVTMTEESRLENITLEVFDVVHVVLQSKGPTEFEVLFNPNKKVIKNKKPSRQSQNKRS